MAGPSASTHFSLLIQALPATENDHRACLHHLVALIHDLNLKSHLAGGLIADFLVHHPDAGGHRVSDEHRAYQPEAIDTVECNDVAGIPHHQAGNQGKDEPSLNQPLPVLSLRRHLHVGMELKPVSREITERYNVSLGYRPAARLHGIAYLNFVERSLQHLATAFPSFRGAVILETRAISLLVDKTLDSLPVAALWINPVQGFELGYQVVLSGRKVHVLAQLVRLLAGAQRHGILLHEHLRQVHHGLTQLCTWHRPGNKAHFFSLLAIECLAGHDIIQCVTQRDHLGEHPTHQPGRQNPPVYLTEPEYRVVRGDRKVARDQLREPPTEAIPVHHRDCWFREFVEPVPAPFDRRPTDLELGV